MKRRRQSSALVIAALLVMVGCSRAATSPNTGNAAGGANEDATAEPGDKTDDTVTLVNDMGGVGADVTAADDGADATAQDDGSENGELPGQCTEYGADLPMPGDPCDAVGASKCTNLDAYIFEDTCSTCYYARTYCVRPWRLECKENDEGVLTWIKADNCPQLFTQDGECLTQELAITYASCQMQPDGSGACCPIGVQTGAGGLCNDEDSLAGGLPLTVKKRACLNSEEILQTHTQDLPVYSECAHAFPQCRFKDYTGDGCSTKNPSVLCEVGKDKWGEPECKCFSSTTVPDETGLLICSTTCEQLGKKAGDCAGRSWPPCGDTRDGEP